MLNDVETFPDNIVEIEKPDVFNKTTIWMSPAMFQDGNKTSLTTGYNGYLITFQRSLIADQSCINRVYL